MDRRTSFSNLGTFKDSVLNIVVDSLSYLQDVEGNQTEGRRTWIHKEQQHLTFMK